jgi:cellulose synthase/poly-beta-1,6-N-acetylglucosamine synthase-like glycosyltransferase
MNGNISVTVVIPAYNAQSTLARALESVLAQTRPAEEIIVVDDASSDDTALLANSYANRDVRLVRLHERRGAAAARNMGIRASKGSWVAFLDADDEWLPGKLEMQVAAILANPEASFIFCASEEFSPEGQSLGDTFRGWPVTASKEAWKALLACNFVATPTVVARRILLLQLGGFNETLKVAEDQDMWIRLALAGPLAYVPDTLARVHVQPESLSSWSPGDQMAYTLPMIEHHLAALESRLSRSETRAIMGARLNKIGLTAHAHGDLWRGLSMILRSMLLGYQPLRSLGTIAKAPLRACLRNTRLFSQRGRTAV